MNDEDVQERIERGDRLEGTEARAYRVIFDALEKEPVFQLPVTFADQVLLRAKRAEAHPGREFFWLLAGLFSFVVALGAAVYFTGFAPDAGAFKFVSNYPGLIVFGVLFVAALHWIDKRLVQKPTARHS